MQSRFGGFTDIDTPQGKPLIEQGKDREDFADFYKYANERGTLFYTPGAQIAKKRPVQACTGPVTYVGQAEIKKEIDTLPPIGWMSAYDDATMAVIRNHQFRQGFVAALGVSAGTTPIVLSSPDAKRAP